ncbi:hypothetical protein PHLGIDRAFT_410732 [Phlebiopsis gigantea 11061_1 CR5-6]|uniref:Putative lipoate-protein ligase A n=1 Tax=Phlebiopsis gigantea (strain 11061_1 CR5-6) TaxID=745531 RepID=A0A0C3RZE1_PHLG1|nr:hypothetical protein PHLGIDRAFT_410732 [Phlebiopsis gigantea 11061_1 CR5-6]
MLALRVCWRRICIISFFEGHRLLPSTHAHNPSERPLHTLTSRRMLLLRTLQHAGRATKCLTHTRSFAVSATTRLSVDRSIYVSKSTNPYFNLTLEDWLFRHKSPKDPLLLFYRDEPCIVIGRNQNPWKEVNLSSAENTGTPWIRRRSGGGTVYHDLGNTNFSIHLSRSAFDRNETGQIVLKAVRSLGVDANLNDRNDICVGKDKISGSAYKIVNNRAYHHGTMLISTRLDTLGDLLRVNKPSLVTKGVASVRSPVRNLQQYNPSVTHEGFVQAVITAFRETYNIRDEVCEVEETEEVKSIPYISAGMEELPQWNWAFGQTPEFTYTLSNTFTWGTVTANIHSKHGMILGCTLETSASTLPVQPNLQGLGEQLSGQKYGFVEEDVLVLEDDTRREVWSWLRNKMSR